MRHAVSFVLCFLVFAGVASAQNVIDPPPGFTKTVNLSGPRFGMTALSTGVVMPWPNPYSNSRRARRKAPVSKWYESPVSAPTP